MKNKRSILLLFLTLFFLSLSVITFPKSYAKTDSSTDILEVTYDEFGAVGDGTTNDYEKIKAAHDFANKEFIENGKKVIVKANKDKTYYIGVANDYIDVVTDVDWNNAKFILDDYIDSNNDGENDVYGPRHIFRIVSPFYIKSKYGGGSAFYAELNDDVISNFKSISPNTTNLKNIIDYVKNNQVKPLKGVTVEDLLEYKYWGIELTASNKMFIRTGNNENNGSNQQEVIVIKSDTGEVLTDINWTYENITSIKIIPINNQKLILQNAIFKTLTCNKVYDEKGNTKVTRRGIQTYYTGNVEINNITHFLDENAHPYQSKYQKEENGNLYSEFVRFEESFFVSLKNSKLTPHHPTTIVKNGEFINGRNGTYDLEFLKSANVFLDNVGYACESDRTDVDCYKDYMLDDEIWGIMGGNLIKNVFITNSQLNRIDSHTVITNLYVNNSRVGVKGLTLIGKGYAYIKNSTIENASAAITLRSDYGSTWDGTIVIDNLHVIKDSPSFSLISSNNKEDHDYGYICYFPNLYLNNLEIEAKNKNITEFDLINLRSITENEVNKNDSRNLYNFKGNILFQNIKSNISKVNLFSSKLLNNSFSLLLTSYGPANPTIDNQVKISLDDTLSFDEKVLPENSKFKIEKLENNIFTDIIEIFESIKEKATIAISDESSNNNDDSNNDNDNANNNETDNVNDNNNNDNNEDINNEEIEVPNTGIENQYIFTIFASITFICGVLCFISLIKNHEFQ